jgi:magnesium transporter
VDERRLQQLETAGRLALERVPRAGMTDPAGAVRAQLRTGAFDAVDLVVLTDREGRYAGVAPIGRLLAAGDETEMAALTDARWPAIASDTDQEHAVQAASLAGVAVLPVVGPDRRPIGVIPAAVLLEVLAREHREDVDRLVGILKERADARHALEDPPLRRVAHRLPWLLIGLAMSASVTGLMASFEEALRANVMIAFFIPAIVYLTDAIGTQTEAIAVRGLSLRDRPMPLVLGLEVVTGASIGLALGLIAFLGVWGVFGNPVLALGVGVSLFAAGSLASAIGLLLPWVLSRLDIDPAFGSGPVATIIQDALTILVYFLVMARLAPGL